MLFIHPVRSDQIAFKEMMTAISKLYSLRKIDESNEFNLLPLTNSEEVSNPNSFLYPLLPAPLPLVQSPRFSQESLSIPALR